MVNFQSLAKATVIEKLDSNNLSDYAPTKEDVKRWKRKNDLLHCKDLKLLQWIGK